MAEEALAQSGPKPRPRRKVLTSMLEEDADDFERRAMRTAPRRLSCSGR